MSIHLLFIVDRLPRDNNVSLYQFSLKISLVNSNLIFSASGKSWKIKANCGEFDPLPLQLLRKLWKQVCVINVTYVISLRLMHFSAVMFVCCGTFFFFFEFPVAKVEPLKFGKYVFHYRFRNIGIGFKVYSALNFKNCRVSFRTIRK